jgi:hypothetical protein
MESETFDKLPKKVFAASGVEIEVLYCDPAYRLIAQRDSKATPTGWLVILSLEPIAKDSELPTFVARWDGEMNDKEAIDVDLIKPESKRQTFKDGLDGYRGHHSKSIVGKTRTFEIGIGMPPSRNIFQALVNCAMLTRGRTHTADAFLKVSPRQCAGRSFDGLPGSLDN